MAYVRNEWKENDIITAEKLNNLEEGCDDIFDLGVVEYEVPTKENPIIRFEGNLTEEQAEKLWNAKRVKFSSINSIASEEVITSFTLNLTQEQFSSSTNPQTAFKNYSITSLRSDGIMTISFLVIISNESSLQNSYTLEIRFIELSN